PAGPWSPLLRSGVTMPETTASFLSQQEQQSSPFKVVTSRQARAIVRRARTVFVMMHVLGMCRMEKRVVLRQLVVRGPQKLQLSVDDDSVCIIAMHGLMPGLDKPAD